MRIGEQTRKTGETDIFVSIQLDGEGNADVHSGIGFFDHMLSAVAKHGLFDLTVRVKGDLEVDGHHTVEDTGIVLGAAIAQAAYLNKVPFVIVRAISDKADDSATMDYPTFEAQAIEHSVKLVEDFVSRIPEDVY